MPLFAFTIFLGAFLLFQVQPMIGKFLLPWFGGGPGIWASCMLFFQVVLLAGYGYAHLLSHRRSLRQQLIVHGTLLVAAICVLPITPSDVWKPHGTSDPRLQILILLTATVGLPYLTLSATGPLIQHWFHRSNPDASPYRLYALSNVGSLLALLSYPFYVESHFPRTAQASIWAWGLSIFTICCAICAYRIWNSPHASSPQSGQTEEPSPLPDGAAPAPSFMSRCLWLLLPACASVLLLAITNKLCQEVTVIPLLWVGPLALYLLSFIICFDSPRWYQRIPFAIALVVALTGMCWALFGAQILPISLQLGVYATGLLVACLVCHGELYRLRPAPAHLTGFYLMIAAGGALGGILVTLVAPFIFTDYYELHWGMLLCAGLALTAWLYDRDWKRLSRWRWHTFAFGLGAISCLAASLWDQAHESSQGRLHRSRNFYGVLTIARVDPSHSGTYAMKFTHGITTHGMQLLDPPLRSLPTTYFGSQSGIGRIFACLPEGPRHIGVIGLGIGTIATYARAGDRLRFYEINPEVEQVARSYFSYLSESAGKVDVALGDARLTLEREVVQQFDLLIMDAFSSDAIPMHLLTREALELYQRHLKPGGIIAVQVSNRHLNLEPVVAQLAETLGYRAMLIQDTPPTDKWWLMTSVWMVLTREPKFVENPIIASAARSAISNPRQVPLWTDEFASLYPILRKRETIPMDMDPDDALIQYAINLTQRGNLIGAMIRYRSTLRINPNSTAALNNLAWLLACTADPTLRNGAEAVQLSEHACRLTDYRETALVGTLAAAYAESGSFAEAIATAERACGLATQSGNDVLLLKNRERLASYREGKAYHDPVIPTESGLSAPHPPARR